jgi:hypothetical protein
MTSIVRCLLLLFPLLSQCALIQLRFHSFDPLHSDIGINLSILNMNNNQGYQIFMAHMSENDSPLTESRIKKLVSFDNGPLIYTPNNAFIFYGNNENALEIAHLDRVDWVGKFDPAFKVNPAFRKERKKACTLEINEKFEINQVEILVNLFPVHPERSEKELESITNKWTKWFANENVAEIKPAGGSRFSISTQSECKLFLF